MNDLLELPPVFRDRDIPRLRRLCDDCETHFRAVTTVEVTSLARGKKTRADDESYI